MGGRPSLPLPPPIFVPIPAPVPPLLPFPVFPVLPPPVGPGGPLGTLIFILFVTKLIQDIIDNRNRYGQTQLLSMNSSHPEDRIPEIPPECMAQLQNPEAFIKSLNIDVPPECMPQVTAALADLRRRSAAA